MTNSNNRTVRIPITNIFGGGDYTSQILVGSEKNPANVILDTGSNTLAVKDSAYAAAQDTNLQPTQHGQAILKLGGQPGPNQSILGLPLMNNYYSVFDRSHGATGVIKFAAIRQPS